MKKSHIEGKGNILLKKKIQHLSFVVNEIILPSWLREGVSENSLEIFYHLCKQICIWMF